MLDLQICKAPGTKLGIHLRKWLPSRVLMSFLMLNKLLDISEAQVSSSSKVNNWRGQFEWRDGCICSLKGMWG